jgi:hypothetical protein
MCQLPDRRYRFRRLANEFEPFRSLLLRHEQVLFAQSQQSAACNARQPLKICAQQRPAIKPVD